MEKISVVVIWLFIFSGGIAAAREREALEINALSANLDYLCAQVTKRCADSTADLRVSFYDRDFENALYNDGHVGIYAGLLEKIETQNELVFLLAYFIACHELKSSFKSPYRVDQRAVAILNCWFGHVAGAVEMIEKAGPIGASWPPVEYWFSSEKMDQKTRIKRLVDYAKKPEYIILMPEPLDKHIERLLRD